jgi:hypothetical protein
VRSDDSNVTEKETRRAAKAARAPRPPASTAAVAAAVATAAGGEDLEWALAMEGVVHYEEAEDDVEDGATAVKKAGPGKTAPAPAGKAAKQLGAAAGAKRRR